MTSPGRLRRIAGLLTGALATIVVAVLLVTGALDGPERSATDRRFELRGAQPAGELAVVGLDEHTFSTMDVTWPVRRSLHAEMIDRLRRAGVRRIVYDVQFTEPSDRPADDLALLGAVERAPGTILATGESDARGATRVLGGDEQLREVGARAAGSTFPADAGGVIRRYSAENTHLASLAAATAASVGRPLPADAFDSRGEAFIDFRGPAGTIPTYSFADVLSGQVDASALRGKIVVVGATAPVLQDVHPTASGGRRLMPGPEIQANAIWTALHGNPLHELPRWAGALIVLIVGLLGAALATSLGRVAGLLATAGLAAAYLGVTVPLFGAGLVLPVVGPLLAIAAAYGSVTLARVGGELAHRAQLARYNDELEREVQRRSGELLSSQLEVVLRLARAAELRDDDTGEHIDRMSGMCGDVARELGFSETDAELLRHASALHDIGKIGVPDDILLKPGKLTDAEFDVMRTHVVQGAELLTGSDSPVLLLAETVCRTHHEKWDGTGYPARIAGEAIPLVGRIAAACDVFDALTHERPYKRAWTIAEACAEVERCRGTHFDPQVADALLAVVEREHGPAAVVGDVAPRLAA